MSQFAIPGLMTAPTTPKEAARLLLDTFGNGEMVVHRSATDRASVAVKIRRRVVGGAFEVVCDDQTGQLIFPARTPAGYDYRLKLRQRELPLPAGELEALVTIPGQPGKVVYITVPDTVVEVARPITTPEPDTVAEDVFGLFNLPEGVYTVRVPFDQPLQSPPVLVLAAVVSSMENPSEAAVLLPTVSGYDTTGLTVVFSSAIPQLGLKLSWNVRTRHTDGAQKKTGQFVLPAGEQLYRVSFATEFATPPTVVLTPQLPYNGGPSVIGFSLLNVTEDGFSVALAGPAAGNFVFNWLARL